MKNKFMVILLICGLLSGCEASDLIDGAAGFGPNTIDFNDRLNQLRDQTLDPASVSDNLNDENNSNISDDEAHSSYSFYPTEPKGKLYPATITRVVDGDTVEIDRVEISDSMIFTNHRVRLIGVDSPEMSTDGDYSLPEPFGVEATEFANTHLLNRTVFLEIKEDAPIDIYDRLLAHVWIDEGDLLGNFNALLLHEGLASVMTIAPHTSYASIFEGIENEARQKRRGMWTN